METFWQDARHGARSLAKRPWFSLVAILTLALGIGANTAIFSVIHAVLLRPLPYTNPEQLVVLWEMDEDGSTSNMSFTTLDEFRSRSQTMDISAVRGWSAVLTGHGDPLRLPGLRVSHNYFDIIGVKMLLGRGFLPEEDTPQTWRVVVLSHGLWQQRFGGDPDIIGRVVKMTNNDFRVVGVLPPDFEPLVSEHFYDRAELWAPLGYALTDRFACRTCRHIRALGRIRPGVSFEHARSELSAIAAQLSREHPTEYARDEAVLVPLESEISGEIRPALYLLFGAVILVLLIACANVSSLLLVRASQREREIAIRACLGAGRWRLVRQLLTESLLLSLAGSVIGLLIASWGIDVLLALGPEKLPKAEAVGIDAVVLAFALGLSLLTALLFGLAPAVFAQRINLVSSLKESARGSTGAGHRRLRSAFVAGNLSVALVLLVGAGLLLGSFVRVLRVDPGFDPSNVLTLQLSALGPKYAEEAPVVTYYSSVVRKLAESPGIEAAGASTQLPLSGNYDRAGLLIEGRPQENPALAPDVERYGIAGDYLRAMRIPLLRGRSFSDLDTADSPRVVVINEAMARQFWPDDEDPIGKRIRLGGEPDPMLMIIGIVGDVRHYRLEEPPTYQSYVPHTQWPGSFMQIAVRVPALSEGLTQAIRRDVWAVDPDLPIYNVISMEAMLSDGLAERRFTMLLLGLFAGLAVTLAAVGLYGSLAYTVAQRTNEIGIRMALGAQRGDILRLVIGQGVKLVAVGVVIGLIGAVAVTRTLQGLLYGVAAYDPWTFSGVTALLVIIALAASYLPARRATQVDPMTALRYE